MKSSLSQRCLLITIAAVLAATTLQAHDFWLEPSTYRPVAGSTVAVKLRVGEHFTGDGVPRRPASIERFFVRQGGRDVAIAGAENADPAGSFRADGNATAVIAYRSRPSYVELPAAKFEEYLREIGEERIIAVRARRGESAKPGREQFSRCAKALLTGRTTSAAAAQPTGLRYELVPDADPTAGAKPFRGRTLYEGKPVSGALVVATFRDEPSVRLSARTNAAGRFTFTLPRRGVWLITSVHMVDAPAKARAQWESIWASLTFETAPR